MESQNSVTFDGKEYFVKKLLFTETITQKEYDRHGDSVADIKTDSLEELILANVIHDIRYDVSQDGKVVNAKLLTLVRDI